MTTEFRTNQPFNSISIVGRRWFQKSYGNTYNTVEIEIFTDAGVFEILLPMEYGYGDYYMQRAWAALSADGWLNITRNSNGSYNTPNWSERENLNIHNKVIDVNRKRDL
jgi:hypothetical protein